jgi:uncharacterized protein
VGRTIFVTMALGMLAGACVPASWGADKLLHPKRRAVTRQPVASFEVVQFEGEGVRLAGRWFHTRDKRGTVVFLHGMSDNRASGGDIADHFVARGFEVIAYDSRAHGESEGEACTYGYYEKGDLRKALDLLPARPVVVLGVSLGGAVALQAAAEEPRIAAVVAVATFSDLRTVATERAPFIATRGDIEAAFRLAERQAHFEVDGTSPLRAAAGIRVPVLLVHGELDHETAAEHSRRILAALKGDKRLLLVPGAGHNDAHGPEVWKEIDGWLDQVLTK